MLLFSFLNSKGKNQVTYERLFEAIILKNKYTKDIILLFGIIVVSAFLARYFAKGETLAEYEQEKEKEESTFMNTTINNTANDALEDSVSTSFSSSDSISDSTTGGVTVTSSTESDSSAKDIADYDNSSSSQNEGDSVESEKENSLRVKYTDDFYFEPLSEVIISRISGISYTPNENIGLEDLSYCSLLYNDFNGETQSGEMICNTSIAMDVMEIFYELYTSGYQIESIRLVDDFDGDDTASMLANNTSCFNYRVVEGSKRLSNHAYGLAIDLNPFYNPYITYNKDGSTNISPEGSEVYADRTNSFPYKIDENDLAYKLFKEHGFKWGGDWNSVKDYQHFEKPN